MTDNVKYTQEHEWLILEGDIVTVGITEYAQNALGDLVFIELPEVGDSFNKGDDFSVIESVKVASEVYSPVSGEIVEVNSALDDDPESLKGPVGDSWIVKIKIEDTSEIDDLLSEEEYNELVEGLDH